MASIYIILNIFTIIQEFLCGKARKEYFSFSFLRPLTSRVPTSQTKTVAGLHRLSLRMGRRLLAAAVVWACAGGAGAVGGTTVQNRASGSLLAGLAPMRLGGLEAAHATHDAQHTWLQHECRRAAEAPPPATLALPTVVPLLFLSVPYVPLATLISSLCACT